MPGSIKEAAMIDPNEFNSSDCESGQTLLQMYGHFKEDIRQEKYGLTQKLFVTLYGSNTASITYSVFRSGKQLQCTVILLEIFS